MADSDSRTSASTGSNNPFRRKSTSAPRVASSADGTVDPVFEPPSDVVDLPLQHPSTGDFFRQQLQALSQTNTPPPSTTFQKPKVVKKVRVQSPPPSSPESAGAPHEYPAYGYRDESSESSSDDDEEPEDPFPAVPPPLGVVSHANYAAPATTIPVSGRPPPNPFKKTLEDIEHAATDSPPLQSGTAGGKGALDVDAFKRLLMTGQATVPGTVPSTAVSSPGTQNPPSLAPDAASITDASSVSRQSIFDTVAVPETTPRTSHEISEAEGDEDRRGLLHKSHANTLHTTSTLRKKPPPPSSRHGRLIKTDLSKQENDSKQGLDGVVRPSSSSSQTAIPGSPGSESSRLRPSTPSDVNKPLPPAPVRRSTDEASESIFDREAAGKVPEPVEAAELDVEAVPTPRPPTPPNASHAATTGAVPSDPRKPPPPPRRSTHSRTESKVSTAPKVSMPAVSALTEEPSIMRRSSQDSTRSRSSSLRVSVHAPAPPPPRRPNHASRPSFTSSSAASFVGLTPTTASAATSPSPSDGEHPPFHSPVPLIAPPEPAAPSPGPTPPGVTFTPTPASAPSPSTAKTKMAPPPLPPARHSTVRSSTGRPASLRSVDAPSRRVKDREGGNAAAPPPPPPPKRYRAGSGRDRDALSGGPVAEEPQPAPAGDVGGRRSEDKSADDILADLSALQREVDALRGKYQKDPAA